MNLSRHTDFSIRMLEPSTRQRRPRVALVLGSGGVRSAAAIGVAEALQAAGVSPDLVVGCSSGALFGALVANRTPPEVAIERAVRLWSQDLTQRHNWKAYAQLLFPRATGFGTDFALRRSHLIAERVEAAFGATQLEALPIPLRVVTTHADSGARTVLSRGSLVKALCASMAVPFIFPPVEIGGQRLVDGVICDPLPVSAASDADVIITLGFAGSMPARVDRPAKLFGQVSTALINNLMEARLESCRAQGRLIVPIDLNLRRRVGLWETAALPAMREAGRDAMEIAMPLLWQGLRETAEGADRGARV